VPAVTERLTVAAVALLELAHGQLAALVVTTVGAKEPIGPSPSIQGLEALVFGAVLLEELVQAQSFLELYWIACHVGFSFESDIYEAIFYSK